MEDDKPYRIDLHNHLVFPEYLKALARFGIMDSGGKKYKEWTGDS